MLADVHPLQYGTVSSVRDNSLRPVVIATGSLVVVLSLFWEATRSWQDVDEDQQKGQSQVAVLDLALGAICGIQIFGVFAAASQPRVSARVHAAGVHTYAVLSLVGSLAVALAGVVRVVMHLVNRNRLINECKAAAQGTGIESLGSWFDPTKEKLDAEDAQNFCSRAWARDSLREIIFLVLEAAFLTIATAVAFAYYQQVLDSLTSAVDASHMPAPIASGCADRYSRLDDTDPYAPSHSPYHDAAADVHYGVGMGMDEGGDEHERESRDSKNEQTKLENLFMGFDSSGLPKGRSDMHSTRT